MFKGDIIPGALAIGFGALFLVPAMKMGFNASTTDGVPGPGFFPIIISSLLIVLGVALLIRGIMAKGKVRYFVMDEDTKDNLKPFFTTIAAIVVYLVLLKLIPFVLASFALLLFLNWVYKRSWKFNLIFSSVFVGLVYVIFTVFLRVQFII